MHSNAKPAADGLGVEGVISHREILMIECLCPIWTRGDRTPFRIHPRKNVTAGTWKWCFPKGISSSRGAPIFRFHVSLRGCIPGLTFCQIEINLTIYRNGWTVLKDFGGSRCFPNESRTCRSMDGIFSYLLGWVFYGNNVACMPWMIWRLRLFWPHQLALIDISWCTWDVHFLEVAKTLLHSE